MEALLQPLLIVLLASCETTPPLAEGLTAAPLSPSTVGVGFTKLDPAAIGLEFVNTLEPEHNKKYLYNGSGLSTGDVDGNGLPDVFLTSIDGPNRLFLQTAPWAFEDATEAWGLVTEAAFSTGVALVDLDGDGDLDLYVCNLESDNFLFFNQGDRFERETDSALVISDASVMPAFSDIDADGDLDLYLLTNRKLHVGEEAGAVKVRLIDDVPTVHPDFRDHYSLLLGHANEAGKADRLLLNQGDGTFVDATAGSGIEGYDMGLSATWFDFDEDGRPDLYVANDMKTPDHLYRNLGEGKFEDVAPAMLPHTSWFSMGSDAGDLDGDGRLDVMVADMSASTHYKQKTTMGAMGSSAWFLEGMDLKQYMRNTVLLNTGTSRFEEAAYLTGLDSTDWSWSVRIDDLDNDGREDVYVTNGHGRNANDSDAEKKAEDLRAAGEEAAAEAMRFELPELPEKNRAFRNLGDLAFEQVDAAWNLDDRGISHGASFTDLDRDGDLDLVVNNLDAPAVVYRNDHGGRAILVSLEGGAIGARVTVTGGGQTQVQELQLSHGYLTSDEAVLHFGLGSADRIERLEVRWPGGLVSSYADLAVDQHYTISPSAAVEAVTVDPPATMFRTLVLPVEHREAPFDDMRDQPLLPWKLSRSGPSLSAGDADGDGVKEVYLGGTAGTGGLMVSLKGMKLQPIEGPWSAVSAREDAGSVWGDFDGDGRLDLYVVAGGVESPRGSAAYRDVLFLNTTEGWKERVIAGRAESGGPVVAADFDGDGDLDVFVGGSSVPGVYPRAEPSRLLLNDGVGHFVVGPAVPVSEVVTGADAADLDGDGDADLLLATEWGPVRILDNDAGIFADVTSEKMAALKGFWHDVVAGDLDGDGDLDLVASNLGLNTKYHVSEGRPVQLYVHDMDGDGSVDLVEAEREGDSLFPLRGLSCTSAAIPAIGERFGSYDAFAKAELEELYQEALSLADVFEATWLEHTVFLQTAPGVFEARPLPRRSQIAPGYGLALEDFDGDGVLDVFMAQNSYAPQLETGRFDGGLSVLLRGGGDGSFTVVPPSESGIVLPVDAKGVVTEDFDGDGDPDLMVGVNDGAARLLLRRP